METYPHLVSSQIPHIYYFIIYLYSKTIIVHLCCVSTIYNMSGRVVSDIQTRAEGENLTVCISDTTRTRMTVVNNLKNDSSYEFIGEVILKINVV